MFTSIVFTAVLASSSVLLSHAIVTPNEPGPGEVFNQGTKCHIGWAGDTDSGSTTAWKNMAIELMTGSNEKMVHVTTVATQQDGTVPGVWDYDCPEVTPNSDIYFYQFTSAGTTNVTWTTRFTIAGADGSTTPPTQTEKASDGTTIGIGNGALVDPSTAVGPPTFDTTNTTTGGSAAGGSSGTNSASVADPNSGSSAPSGTPSNTANNASQKPSGTAGQTSAPKSSAPSNSSAAPSQSGSSAAVAVGPMVLDARVWPFVVALTACASAFTILL
jgi:hypothetical protein